MKFVEWSKLEISYSDEDNIKPNFSNVFLEYSVVHNYILNVYK